jgi:hypothetical protein
MEPAPGIVERPCIRRESIPVGGSRLASSRRVISMARVAWTRK